MSQVYITVTRTDIPNGVLQIRDLWPNPTQYNPVIDPTPEGPFYLSQPENNTVATLTATGDKRSITRTVSGLSAYLVATVAGATVGGDITCITAVNANNIATAILNRMRNGLALALANINALIAAEVAGSGLVGTKTSTGRVADILAILTGAVFTLPAGHQVQDTDGVFSPIATNSIDDYFIGEKNNRLLDSDVAVSAAKGALSVMLSDNFTYKGTANNCVAIYNSNGTVFDPNA
jgi:hypothetical protein